MFDQIRGGTIFSKIDLYFTYYQLKIKSEDVPKSTFSTRYEQYEFLVFPFGLTNAPSTFMGMINRMLREYQD